MGILQSKVALVTGGGRGIGRAVALRFAAEGARVAVAARTESQVRAVASLCGIDAFPITLDVTDEAACEQATRIVQDELGPIEILVNNAGIATAQKFSELSTGVWRSTFAVGVDGPYFLTRAVLPEMLKRRSGTIISMGSIASRVGAPYVAAYTAAKHALLGLTRSLAAEFAAEGVTFNCICPGYTDSPMTETTIRNIMTATGRTKEEATRPLLSPQGRLVSPGEIAALCVLLASDAGRAINGQAINVDGGQVQS